MNRILRTGLRLIPDELYLQLKSLKVDGRFMNLKNPHSFNEKINWLKIHDRKPEYTKMVDKYEAKKYVGTIIGEQHIIPTLGVWNHFDEIDFCKLPDQFVLKCTHDSGGIVVCRDKETLDFNLTKTKLNQCLSENFYWYWREWPYKGVKPRIIAEQYMDDGHKGLRDYKFFNFNKKAKFLYVSEGLEDHKTAAISFFDFDGKKLPFGRPDYKAFDGDCDLPDNFSEMMELSDKLASTIECPFSRTDFYSINGEIYFSEITFSPCSGFMPITPPEWNDKLGEMIELG